MLIYVHCIIFIRYIYQNYQRRVEEEDSSDEGRRRYFLESSLVLCSTPFYEKTIERQNAFHMASATVKVQGSVRQVLEKLYKASTSELANLDRELCEIQIKQAVILELEKKFDQALETYEKLAKYAEIRSEKPLESPIDEESMEEEMKEIINEQIRYWRHIHHKTGKLLNAVIPSFIYLD